MRNPRRRAKSRIVVGAALLLLSGSVQAQLSPENAVSCVEGVTLSVAYGDHTIDCEIGNETDLDLFTFQGTAGDEIRIVFGGFDAVLELRDPFDNPLSDGGSGVNDWVLPETGAYQLRVFDSQSAYTGLYRFQLERTWPLFWGAGLSHDDTPFADRVDPGTDTDWLVFKGRSGTRVRLIVEAGTGAGFDPSIEVFSPDGAFLGGAGCSSGVEPCSFSSDFNLTQDGNQYVQFFDGPHNTIGDYEIGLQCLFGDCPLGYYIRSAGFDSPIELSWEPVSDPDATYDVVKGDLHDLRDSNGDFSGAVTDCVSSGNVLPFTDAFDELDSGEAVFYVVRALQDDIGAGSYDTGRASQISRYGGRDLGPLSINSSPYACGNTLPGPAFTPDEPLGDVHMAAGAVDDPIFDVEIRVTDIEHFYGIAFHVSYDPGSVAFSGYDSTGSFLLGSGEGTVFNAALVGPGEVAVAATMLGQVAGLSNANGLVITLQFVATATTPSSPFAFLPEAFRNVKVCPTATEPCYDIAGSLTWTGGTLVVP